MSPTRRSASTPHPPDAALDPLELYFIRVRADVSLNGVNSWIARFSGEAVESDWVQSLFTPTRRQ